MAKENWVATDATIASVEEHRLRSGVIRYVFVFTYVVGGSWHGGTCHTYETSIKGDRIPIRYDPAHPERNDLVDRERFRRMRNWAVSLVTVMIAIYLLMR